MSLIYEPRGRAREYAALACNIYRGCDHGCTYCYAPSATFRTPADFRNSELRKTFSIAKLAREAKKLRGTNKRVLLCFTTDPYQHLNDRLTLTREVLELFRHYSIPFQVLTKGGYRALPDIDLYSKRDAFATTMTLLDESQSRLWEPNAAMPSERIYTLSRFHNAGVETWVSLEPVIDPAQSLEIIRQTHLFVDLFKVGTMNHNAHAKKIDWQKFALDAVELLKSLDKPYYIKHDLQKWLPDGITLSQRSTDFAPSV